MKHYGIIGKPLAHSRSAAYFTDKFQRESIAADYVPYQLDTLEELPELDGFNVTIPYKEIIISKLRRTDVIANEIGAVNVVKTTPVLTGYNTDWIGFCRSIRPLLTSEDHNALVLGTGGAAKAITYGLKTLRIDSRYVSRSGHNGTLTYGDLTREIIDSHTVIINATPVGMWPNEGLCPDIPYEFLGGKHLLFDCIYNPEITLFMKKGMQRGARTKNGLEMWHIQAEETWKIWTNNEY